MADEPVGVIAETEDEQVSSEVSETAEPKVGEETDPQEPQEQGEEELKPHKKGGWQRKIEKLERRNEELMTALLSREQKAEAKPVVEEAEPDPDKFESTLDYLKAVRKYDREQLEKTFEAKLATKDQERTQKTEQQQQAEAWTKSREEAKSRYSDLEDALSNEDAPCSRLMSEFMLKNAAKGNGIDVAYYLGTHPEEAQRIAAMTSKEDVFESMGEIKGLVKAQLAKDDPPAKEKQVTTRAPKPPTLVRKPSASDDGELRDDLPPEEWSKRFKAKLEKRR